MDEHGRPCAKDKEVEVIWAAAVTLGFPEVAPDGLQLRGGHALRVGGAQSLARAGLCTWIIQLLGRWGSDAVLGYVRAAPLAASTSWAAAASSSLGPELSWSASSLAKFTTFAHVSPGSALEKVIFAPSSVVVSLVLEGKMALAK